MEISIRDLVSRIQELSGYDGEIRWDATKPDGQPRRQLDVVRAQREFGFVAEMPFVEGLNNTIEWYLEHQPLTRGDTGLSDHC
jgi:GDP-L-fucose synthase